MTSIVPTLGFLARVAVLRVLTVLDLVIVRTLRFLAPSYYSEEKDPLFLQNQNGSSVTRSGREYGSVKRIKLLLDIDVGPGPSDAHVVSATEVHSRSSSFFLIRWAMFWLTAMQSANSYVLENLEAYHALDQDSKEDTRNNTPNPTPDRKIKSPRKRLSESNLKLPVKLMKFFGVSKPFEPASISFEMPSTEALLKMRNDKAKHPDNQKHPEKRKHSDDESTAVTTDTLTNEESSSEDEVKSSSVQNLEAGSTNGQLNGSHHRRNLVRFLGNDGEEDPYESAEDPNYSPNEDDLDASSSTNESFPDEIALLNELYELKEVTPNGNPEPAPEPDSGPPENIDVVSNGESNKSTVGSPSYLSCGNDEAAEFHSAVADPSQVSDGNDGPESSFSTTLDSNLFLDTSSFLHPSLSFQSEEEEDVHYFFHSSQCSPESFDQTTSYLGSP